MADLDELRKDIDEIDAGIVELYKRRMDVSDRIAEYKISVGKPVLDKEREKQKIETLSAMAGSAFDKAGISSLFSHLMSISRMRQYQATADKKADFEGFTSCEQRTAPDTRVVFQGVKGSYGHEAMEMYFGKDIDGYNALTFREVMEEVASGRASYGVLPIENSSTGIITDVYDLLEEFDNYIAGEQVVKVEHALLGVPGSKIEDIKTVYSHPQGLMQCRAFLNEMQWEEISLKNTAVAAQKVITDNDKSQAAIASRRAAAFHGLTVLKEKINDIDNNSTRFIIVKNRKEYYKDADKVSICFELPHETGTLYNVLAHFIFNRIN
ncbi:MAG: chorismate mutase, partial [Lachnospiraceae bacterium]|nr:chorismate mutase [Lachnospiraceae bacterium]